MEVSGVPRADETRPGEIGYYAPGSRLVLYYASPDRWPGLMRIGRFDPPLERLRALPFWGGRGEAAIVPMIHVTSSSLCEGVPADGGTPARAAVCLALKRGQRPRRGSNPVRWLKADRVVAALSRCPRILT